MEFQAFLALFRVLVRIRSLSAAFGIQIRDLYSEGGSGLWIQYFSFVLIIVVILLIIVIFLIVVIVLLIIVDVLLVIVDVLGPVF